jgi:quinol---cytochrome c reductase iron-sulfur subunit, bacillus type
MAPRETTSKLTGDRGVPGAFEGETITRRRLMTGGAHAMGAIAAASIGLPVLGFAFGPVFARASDHWEAVGLADEFDERTVSRRVITTSPGVGDAGKSTVYIRRRNPLIDTEPEDQFNRFVAISSRCVHVGCPVNYVPAAERFVCPCHGGVYDIRGLRTSGPPPRPLDRFFTRVRGGELEIGPRFSVNSRLRRFSPRDPGEALDGIGQYLYPPRLTTEPAPR